ncbi:hypothetical protein DPMN_175237 [Dreissena polymorpha]|uniref:Uncharacterized protein n=1 Tax=Dreissena polymorpha TaxID=45954 RepID=A0A9D4E636_DREPO|nr:hypothetical protein DPMN_175237 [Dreissena polymorpha]
MEFSGLSESSWKTSTLRMIWLFSPTPKNICKKIQTKFPKKNYVEEQSSSQLKKTSFREVGGG